MHTSLYAMHCPCHGCYSTMLLCCHPSSLLSTLIALINPMLLWLMHIFHLLLFYMLLLNLRMMLDTFKILSLLVDVQLKPSYTQSFHQDFFKEWCKLINSCLVKTMYSLTFLIIMYCTVFYRQRQRRKKQRKKGGMLNWVTLLNYWFHRVSINQIFYKK